MIVAAVNGYDKIAFFGRKLVFIYVSGSDDVANLLCVCHIRKSLKMAEGERFELSVGRPTTVFKTVAINHSATPPYLGGLYCFFRLSPKPTVLSFASLRSSSLTLRFQDRPNKPLQPPLR